MGHPGLGALALHEVPELVGYTPRRWLLLPLRGIPNQHTWHRGLQPCHLLSTCSCTSKLESIKETLRPPPDSQLCFSQQQTEAQFHSNPCKTINNIPNINSPKSICQKAQTTMPQYEGQCHCGQIAWTAEIREEKHILCHCGACKLMGGGEFTLNQIIPKDNFKLTKGELRVYTYKGDSGMYIPTRTRSPSAREIQS